MCSVNIGWDNEYVCTRELDLLYRQSIIEEKRGMAFIATAWVSTVPPSEAQTGELCYPQPFFCIEIQGSPLLFILSSSIICFSKFMELWALDIPSASPFWCLSPVRITMAPATCVGNSSRILWVRPQHRDTGQSRTLPVRISSEEWIHSREKIAWRFYLHTVSEC